jgi:hypothetical protein
LDSKAHTLVTSEDDVRVLQESSAQHIAESMVLLVKREDRAVRGTYSDQSQVSKPSCAQPTGIRGLGDLLFAVAKKEQLESAGGSVNFVLCSDSHFDVLVLVIVLLGFGFIISRELKYCLTDTWHRLACIRGENKLRSLSFSLS